MVSLSSPTRLSDEPGVARARATSGTRLQCIAVAYVALCAAAALGREPRDNVTVLSSAELKTTSAALVPRAAKGVSYGDGAVRRASTPEPLLNPAELKAGAKPDGRLTVAFHRQPWKVVLAWLAEISGASLSCHAEPPGYVDFVATRFTSLEDVRDCLNCILLSKGYTLVRHGSALTLVALKSLDLQYIPHVSASDLESLGRYEFAVVYFDLSSLSAQTVASEIRQTLGRNGQTRCLKTMNRLAVMDTGENLRRVRDLLTDEEARGPNTPDFCVFRLRYVRADEVANTIGKLFGVDRPARLTAAHEDRAFSPRVGVGYTAARKAIALAVDTRQNAILATGPVDQMGAVRRAVAILDVPRAPNVASRAENEWRTYSLSTVDGASLMRLLGNVGVLDEHVHFAIHGRSNAIVVCANRKDHLAIASIIEQLDGDSRHAEVVQLRSLDAVEIARMIERLLNSGDGGSSLQQLLRSDNSTAKTGLLVRADAVGNRLFLRATASELREINILLAKLGEQCDVAPDRKLAHRRGGTAAP